MTKKFVKAKKLILKERLLKGSMLWQDPAKKKGVTPEQNVEKIISKDQDNFEYELQFYKRIGNSRTFVKESPEVFEVVAEGIIVKLSKLVSLSGSKKTQGYLWL